MCDASHLTLEFFRHSGVGFEVLDGSSQELDLENIPLDEDSSFSSVVLAREARCHGV